MVYFYELQVLFFLSTCEYSEDFIDYNAYIWREAYVTEMAFFLRIFFEVISASFEIMSS